MNRTVSRLAIGFTAIILAISCQKDKDKKPQPSKPSNPIASLEAAEKMGRGVNLGNTFDAYNQVWMKHDFPHTKSIIDLYKKQGMTNIRIPITWMQEHEDGTLADENGRVNTKHPRFKDLVATIDYALAQGLIVVINTHHEHWLKLNYDNSEEMNRRFTTLWTDIATYFRDYPFELMFEVLNEPEGVFGDWGSTQKGVRPGDPQGIALTRVINQVGYDAIRKTGGRNLQRMVIIAPNGQGNHSQIDDVYPVASLLPGAGKDPYVMATVHSYDPWDFCGQTGSNLHYKGTDVVKLRSDLDNVVKGTAAWSKQMGVGIYFGEYGVGRDGPITERDTPLVREYYRYLTQSLIDAKMGTAAWDDKGWFGLLNPEGESYRFVYGLIDAVMGRPEPTTTQETPTAPTSAVGTETVPTPEAEVKP